MLLPALRICWAKGERLRLDLVLLRLRFTRSRSLAQTWIGKGHIRLNRSRITKCGQQVTAGDVLTLPLHSHVQVIEILALPNRRGPASEAESYYRVLDGGEPFALAGSKTPPLGRKLEGLSSP